MKLCSEFPPEANTKRGSVKLHRARRFSRIPDPGSNCQFTKQLGKGRTSEELRTAKLTRGHSNERPDASKPRRISQRQRRQLPLPRGLSRLAVPATSPLYQICRTAQSFGSNRGPCSR